MSDTLPLGGATPWRHLRAVWGLAGSAREQEAARDAWANGLPPRCAVWVQHFLALRGGRRDRTPEVVHIIANAVLTASAVRLELSRPDATVSDVRGDLLRADELPALCPRAGLYVLQSPPLPSATRTYAEREQAALLRGFAAELSALGAPAVVTVPPLPEAQAWRVIRELGDAILGSPWSYVGRGRPWRGFENRGATPALSHAVGRINRKVLAASDQLEPAFDVCMYVNTWRGGGAAPSGAVRLA